MFLDNQLTLSAAQAITASAASTNIIELAGVGSGNAPNMRFGIQSSVFGEDIGIGDGDSPPSILCIVGTAFTAGGAATLQVALQTAPDNGSNAPGTWSTAVQTDVLALSQLTAGQKIAEFTVPPRDPNAALPRFLRLYFTVGTGPMTGGTISYAGTITGRDDFVAYGAAY